MQLGVLQVLFKLVEIAMCVTELILDFDVKFTLVFDP